MSPETALPGNGAIHLSMPGMSAQVPQERGDKPSGLNPFTVTNVLVLVQLESERRLKRPLVLSETADGWRMRKRHSKNHEGDSTSRWFHFCGGEIKLPTHNIFLSHVRLDPAVPRCVCAFLHMHMRMFPPPPDTGCFMIIGKCTQKPFLIASGFFHTECEVNFEIRITRTWLLCSTLSASVHHLHM